MRECQGPGAHAQVWGRQSAVCGVCLLMGLSRRLAGEEPQHHQAESCVCAVCVCAMYVCALCMCALYGMCAMHVLCECVHHKCAM